MFYANLTRYVSDLTARAQELSEFHRESEPDQHRLRETLSRVVGQISAMSPGHEQRELRLLSRRIATRGKKLQRLIAQKDLTAVKSNTGIEMYQDLLEFVERLSILNTGTKRKGR